MSGKFGEPWETDWHDISRPGGTVATCAVGDWNIEACVEHAARIVDCVNALAGLNPSAIRGVIEAAKSAVAGLTDARLGGDEEYARLSVCYTDGVLAELRKALAAL